MHIENCGSAGAHAARTEQRPAPLTQDQQACLATVNAFGQQAFRQCKLGGITTLEKCFAEAARFDDPSRPEFRELAESLAKITRSVFDQIDDQALDRRHLLRPLLDLLGSVSGELGHLMGPDTMRGLVESFVAKSEGHAKSAILAAAQCCKYLEDIGIAVMVVQAAVKHHKTEAVLSECAALVKYMPQVVDRPAGLVAQACMELMEAQRKTEPKKVPTVLLRALGGLIGALTSAADGGASLRQVGGFFSGTAQWAMDELAASRDASAGWLAVSELFDDPDLPVEHKQQVAQLMAQGLAGESGDLCRRQLATNEPYVKALCQALAHMPEPLRPAALASLVENTEFETAKTVSVWFEHVPALVQSVSDEQVREQLQARLYPKLLQFAEDESLRSVPQTLLKSIKYLMLVDRGTNPHVLDILMKAADQFCTQLPVLQDEFALLTFQADPDGGVFRPGTQERDVSNEKNPDMLVGKLFFYPRWLADRRALLQQAAPAIVEGRVRDRISPIPLEVREVAQITENYSGLPVQPSDWPKLLQVLQQARPAHQAAQVDGV
jgi:hypothetical protein